MKRQRPPESESKRPSAVASAAFPTDDEHNKKDNKQKEEEEIVLTPHTLRLLKLIQDGTHQHASMAAVQLATITSHSSPLVVWDVLGRLQAFLVSANWATRQQASAAMEGVARHLPLKSRVHFLHHVMDDNVNNQTNYLWLTVKDFQQAQSVIWNQGRLLWAHSAETNNNNNNHDREEEEMRRIDQEHLRGVEGNITNNKEDLEDDFVQRRVQRQRRILAQRIGLSGLLQATGGVTESCLAETITSEDLQSTTTSRPTKRFAKGKKDESNSSKEAQNAQSVRALLVLEMKREQQQTSSSSSLSHSNSQVLLATELLYRVFDPIWHVRHGALLGMLSLLRAWHHSGDGRNNSNNDNAASFGAWPQDILARCLCLLLLDKFGDYSGTTITTTGMGAESGSVVAPVRETAGQLLAMVWHMAPESIQNETLELLYGMATAKGNGNNHLAKDKASNGNDDNSNDEGRAMDWEIRHGVLAALKYIVAVQVGGSRTERKTQTFRGLSGMAQIASECLGDDSDDVQSAAAQILSTLLSMEGQEEGWHKLALERVWRALQRARSVSSAILDLVSLCSLLLQQSKGNLPTEVILHKEESDPGRGGSGMLDDFRLYLDHDLASVRVAAMRSIAQVVDPMWKMALDSGAGDLRSLVCDSLDKVQERLFLSFLEMSLCNNQQGDNMEQSAGDPETSDTFRSCCTLAWNNLIHVLGQRANHDDQKLQADSLACRLTLLFFGIEEQKGMGERNHVLLLLHKHHSDMPLLIDAADALSDILCSFPDAFEASGSVRGGAHLELLEVALKALLHSPWLTQCEAACLLFRALSKKARSDQSCKSNGAILRILDASQKSIITLLALGQNELAPPCLAVEACSQTKDTLQDINVLHLRNSSFLKGIEIVQRSSSHLRISEAVDCIRTSFKHAVTTKGGDESVLTSYLGEVVATRASMRLFAVMAGAILAANNGTMPLKKATPLVRPLMTSLKNEKDPKRRLHTCEFMAEMLCLMFVELIDKSKEDSIPAFLKPREKVLSTMCDAVSVDVAVDGEGAAFARVIQSFLKTLSRHIDSLECIRPIWSRLQPLLIDSNDLSGDELLQSLNLLELICGDLPQGCALISGTISSFMPKVVLIACRHDYEEVRSKARRIVRTICSGHIEVALLVALPGIIESLEDRKNDSCRLSATETLQEIVGEVGMGICPFVRRLLRLVMSLMADPLPDCAKNANAIFACLVRVAPLVPCDEEGSERREGADFVVDHLIHGRPLPPYALPSTIEDSLRESGVSLRQYQMEGVTWLRFLQTVNLNGALCDSMGLGKTLQALAGIAIAHVDGGNIPQHQETPKSIVVCPASVVGHWEREIERFFSPIFTCLAFFGNAKERKAMWKKFASCNIVVTSYSVLRTDVDVLSKQFWRYCCLDEGHLVRNRNTATAKACRRIRAQHRLILTGTPVQNKVQEIFAAFDFLMPNFLGSNASFAKEFASPITKGHLSGATAESIGLGIDKLKVLHQQVLPFILRREKDQVLKELPPKCVSTVPCRMSNYQRTMYQQFLASEEGKKSVQELQRVLQQSLTTTTTNNSQDDLSMGSSALKTLLFLRLLCTHPFLVEQNRESRAFDIEMSGKFLALAELLRACGVHRDQVTGADNDSSLLYCNNDEDDGGGDGLTNLLDSVQGDNMLDASSSSVYDSGSKCLVFAQFTQSLDAVEELLIKRHMPSLRYLRLDGRVPANKRSSLVDTFNDDPSVKLMLLTTRVGGLGLNLTGADTVIFLENDFNPFADLQAADRAHRIGQAKTVNVYRLVTKDTIEEKIMSIQEKKLAMSKAIVNTDNSTLFSMGTDRLLDIFTCRADTHETSSSKKDEQSNGVGNGVGCNLDALVDSYKEEYNILGVKDFIDALRPG